MISVPSITSLIRCSIATDSSIKIEPMSKNIHFIFALPMLSHTAFFRHPFFYQLHSPHMMRMKHISYRFLIRPPQYLISFLQWLTNLFKFIREVKVSDCMRITVTRLMIKVSLPTCKVVLHNYFYTHLLHTFSYNTLLL